MVYTYITIGNIYRQCCHMAKFEMDLKIQLTHKKYINKFITGRKTATVGEIYCNINLDYCYCIGILTRFMVVVGGSFILLLFIWGKFNMKCKNLKSPEKKSCHVWYLADSNKYIHEKFYMRNISSLLKLLKYDKGISPLFQK